MKADIHCDKLQTGGLGYSSGVDGALVWHAGGPGFHPSWHTAKAQISSHEKTDMMSAVTVPARTDQPGLTVHHLSVCGHQWTPVDTWRRGRERLSVLSGQEHCLARSNAARARLSFYLSVTGKKANQEWPAGSRSSAERHTRPREREQRRESSGEPNKTCENSEASQSHSAKRIRVLDWKL